jgi:membrane dipeptidase
VHGGLTELGQAVVLEMNRLGILVDISHVSDETLADALEVSRAPVFASHSSCRGFSNIPRNLTDDQIRAIAKKGGVVMVNIGSMFLDQKVVDEFVAKRSALKPRIAELEAQHRDDKKQRDAAISKLLNTIKYAPASWTRAVDHIERILKVGGPEAAGLGSDFDGIEDPPEGLEDISKLPRLTEELLRRGHPEAVVRGVLGENFLKFWARAEAAKTSVPPRKEPPPFSKP